jgi:DNA-binding Lrp family transcriptional regulator
MDTLLDEIDVKLIRTLIKNARITDKKLAEMHQLSVQTVARRLNALEDAGIIREYAAILDPARIGRGLVAFTHVQLKDHSEASLRGFEEAIVRLPEVIECYHMSGAYDFILRVAVRDLDCYHDFLMDELYEISNISAVQSTFVLKESKHEVPSPLN